MLLNLSIFAGGAAITNIGSGEWLLLSYSSGSIVGCWKISMTAICLLSPFNDSYGAAKYVFRTLVPLPVDGKIWAKADLRQEARKSLFLRNLYTFSIFFDDAFAKLKTGSEV